MGSGGVGIRSDAFPKIKDSRAVLRMAIEFLMVIVSSIARNWSRIKDACALGFTRHEDSTSYVAPLSCHDTQTRAQPQDLRCSPACTPAGPAFV